MAIFSCIGKNSSWAHNHVLISYGKLTPLLLPDFYFIKTFYNINLHSPKPSRFTLFLSLLFNCFSFLFFCLCIREKLLPVTSFETGAGKIYILRISLSSILSTGEKKKQENISAIVSKTFLWFYRIKNTLRLNFFYISFFQPPFY